MKAAYVNAIGGASGDMLLASLIDSGLNTEQLTAALSSIGISGFCLRSRLEERQGVKGTYLDVDIGTDQAKKRTPTEFIHLVNSAPMSESSKAKCVNIFNIIGEAEGALHGEDPGHVHLHELGTIDTIIDVAGVVLGLEMMSVEKLYSSALPTGSGTVKTQHGILPVPAPATAHVLSKKNVPCYPPPVHLNPTGEMLTPTGVALLAELADFSQPVMKIDSIGYGLGTRDPEQYPNVLSISIGEVNVTGPKSGILLLETNLDDTTGETLGYVQEKLFEMGSRDVWFTPIQMKKNRPGTMLSCLIDESLKLEVADFIMLETTTLGIRVRSVDRIEAERKLEKFASSVGEINVKLKKQNGVLVSISPEYEDCKKIADRLGMPLARVYSLIHKEAEDAYLQTGY